MRGKSAFWEWLLPIAWMCVIAYFSTDSFSAQRTEGVLEPVIRYVLPEAPPSTLSEINVIIRKLAHASEYGLLALLWCRAFLRSRAWSTYRAVVTSLIVACAWAAADEFHQSFVASRSGSVLDVALDASGAVGALALGALHRRVKTNNGN